MNAETLILKSDMAETEWFLCDANNHLIGRFPDHLPGVKWAAENGYRVRVQWRNGRVKFYSPADFAQSK